MRFLLSISALVLHVIVFTTGTDSFVHADQYKQRPSGINSDSENQHIMEMYAQTSLETVTESVNAFSHKLFQELAKRHSDNLIYSPLSVALMMSMVSYGAAGDTRRQMRSVLELPRNDFMTKIGMRFLIDNLSSYNRNNMKIANKIFLQYGLKPKSKYMHIVHNVFRTTFAFTDLHDGQYASPIVNKWCEVETNNRITDMTSPDNFNGDMTALLLNAVYFKGSWLTKFNQRFTMERPFFVNGYNERNVMTMFVSGRFRYGGLPALRSTFIELPYKSEDNNHNISMFVILPNKRDGLAKLEEAFHTVTVKDLLRAGEMTEVDVLLPKFKIESKIDLVEPLMNMGMTKAFQRSDFSNFAEDINLRLNKVVQKAVVAVDELGSEAAAVTESDLTDKLGSQSFTANHPFIAVIAITSGTPVNLFTVRYTGSQ